MQKTDDGLGQAIVSQWRCVNAVVLHHDSHVSSSRKKAKLKEKLSCLDAQLVKTLFTQVHNRLSW